MCEGGGERERFQNYRSEGKLVQDCLESSTPLIPIPPARVSFLPALNNPADIAVCFSLPPFPCERWEQYIWGCPYFYIQLLCVCVHAHKHARACYGRHVGVGGPLWGISSLYLPPCGSQGSNSDHQSWHSKCLFALGHFASPHIHILYMYVCACVSYMCILETDNFIHSLHFLLR